MLDSDKTMGTLQEDLRTFMTTLVSKVTMVVFVTSSSVFL